MLTHLTDFPDRFSPMLVKELRQGMRARGFIILFVSFQLLLAFILVSASAASGNDYAGAAASGIIFTIFGIAVLGIQPMRGVNALSSEITGNTIEMMVLTRLSASRIVFGKWIAIVSQSALLLVTIVPYLILRYFFGGMNLMGELVLLALIFLSSMALTAVMVGLSGNTTKAARALPIVGFIILVQFVPRFLFRGGLTSGMDFFTLATWESRITIFCYVAIIAYLGWCALSHGISAIAPVAENHSTPRRLVALALTLAVAAATFHPDMPIAATCGFLAVILLPALVTALTESAVTLPPLCQPFLKRGLPGRIAAAFLLPGWPTGVFYTCLVAGISAFALANSEVASYGRPDLPGIWAAALACFGSLLLPALLSACFTKQESKRFTFFIAFLVVSIAISVFGQILTGIKRQDDLMWLFVWNPPTVLFMLSNYRFSAPDLMVAISVVDACLLFLLIVVALRRYSEDYQRVFKECKLNVTPPPDAIFAPDHVS
jgi:hypothetical protein